MSNQPAKASAEALEGDYALFTHRGRCVLELFAKRDLAKLYRHLHNGNRPLEFVMGFRDRDSDTPRYARSKKVQAERAITWAISTIEGATDKPLAFVPYATNPQGMTRWAAFDFDAHDGNVERARRYALAAFERLQSTQHFLMLESSGRGGWHVWLINRDFQPVSYWNLLLGGIARDIGAPIQAGVCEIFPPDSMTGTAKKAVRAPGTWNPTSQTLSEIHFSTVEELIPLLPDSVSGKRGYSLSETALIEKQISFSSAPLSTLLSVIGKDGSEFSIPHQGCRHDLLKAMVGQIYFQVSVRVGEAAALAQFRERRGGQTPEAEHLKEFQELWQGMTARWLAELTEQERVRFDTLEHPTDRDAFRIVWSFNRLAKAQGETEFPICRDNFAARLGLTPNAGGNAIRRLCDAGIIRKTKPRVTNVRCARYAFEE
jgi:hypothetical protein